MMNSNSGECAVILGQGRSGTNWLSQLLDMSPDTHVRNEPNEIPACPLNLLPSPDICGVGHAALKDGWEHASAHAMHHFGIHDPRAPIRKSYYHSLSSFLHLPSIMFRPRLRGATGVLWPSLRCNEWRLPFWIGSQKKLERSLHILKIVQAPNWASWILEHEPTTKVIHIVRHPGGFLNSWRRRYLAHHDSKDVLQANLVRMRRLADSDPRWASMVGDIDQMSVDESELWYWRYAAEKVDGCGSSRHQYMLVIFEDLVEETGTIVERLYSFLGLELGPESFKGILSTTRHSKSISQAWTRSLSSQDIELVERVLQGSPMEKWWS